MTAVAQIKQFLSSIPYGQPFSSSSLRPFAATENIRQILNRLVKSGELKKVARGVFVKPQQISQIGAVLPAAEEVAKMLADSTGETIAVSGAEAARQLQLTTQVPMRLVFYTSGNTRTLKIANRSVKLKHVNPSVLVATDTVPGLVVSALRYLGRNHVTVETIEALKGRISAKDFCDVFTLMRHMPTWMSDVFYRYHNETKA